jgi:hypothetical protein
MATKEERPGHQERRESTIDIMASWALEGMEPTPEVLARIRAYVNGDVSLDEAIARAKALYGQGRSAPVNSESS